MLFAVQENDSQSAIITDNGQSNGLVQGIFTASEFVRNVLNSKDSYDMGTEVKNVMDSSPTTCITVDTYAIHFMWRYIYG